MQPRMSELAVEMRYPARLCRVLRFYRICPIILSQYRYAGPRGDFYIRSTNLKIHNPVSKYPIGSLAWVERAAGEALIPIGR